VRRFSVWELRDWNAVVDGTDWRPRGRWAVIEHTDRGPRVRGIYATQRGATKFVERNEDRA
jgi:hypothetical protein